MERLAERAQIRAADASFYQNRLTAVLQQPALAEEVLGGKQQDRLVTAENAALAWVNKYIRQADSVVSAVPAEKPECVASVPLG